jgi:hypothetical protein
MRIFVNYSFTTWFSESARCFACPNYACTQIYPVPYPHNCPLWCVNIADLQYGECLNMPCNVSTQLSPAMCLYWPLSMQLNTNPLPRLVPSMCLNSYPLSCAYTIVSGHVSSQPSLFVCINRWPWPNVCTAVPDLVSTQTSLAMCLHNRPQHFAYTAVPSCVITQMYCCV